ncbi:MAG: DUF4190 domain-containing protein, partial [Candidatus Woesearchaeota archaeon]|nr:DUF4190 domain-containing protein [Candidatus Woesearchaeota archaeon]
VIKTRSEGYTDEKIRATLKGSGYSDIAIDEAMSKEEEAKPDKTSVMAIFALVFAFIFPLVGLILGFIALSKIKKTGEGGRGLAIAALIISALLFLVNLVFLMIFMSAFFGVLNPQKLLPEKCQSTAGLDCISMGVFTGDTVTIALRNNMATQIMITDVAAMSGSCIGSREIGLGNSDFIPLTSTEVQNNQAFRLKLNGCKNGKIGSRYEDTIIVSFKELESGLDKKNEVEIRGKII